MPAALTRRAHSPRTWPSVEPGDGATLRVARPARSESDPRRWAARSAVAAHWGAQVQAGIAADGDAGGRAAATFWGFTAFAI